MDPRSGGKVRQERKGHRGGGARRGNAGHPGDGANPRDKEGEVVHGHIANHLGATWICVDGRGPPSH